MLTVSGYNKDYTIFIGYNVEYQVVFYTYINGGQLLSKYLKIGPLK